MNPRRLGQVSKGNTMRKTTRAGAAGVGILKTTNSLPILAEGAIA